jgi:hypothetical protein
MIFSISRWRPGHLLAAWSAYWVGLAAVTLTPIFLAISRASSAAGGAAGSSNASVSFGDAGLSVTVKRLGQVTFERSAGLLPIALWIGLPPLALWGLWVYRRSRAIESGALGDAAAGAPALGEPAPEIRAQQREHREERR